MSDHQYWEFLGDTMDRRTAMALVEELAPLRYAASWDNSGLQVGSAEGEVTGVLVAVNPSPAAARHASSSGHNLLITHHPLIFKATKQLATDRDPGRTIAHLLAHDITAYAAHTNLDATACNYRLADLLGWRLDRVLDPGGSESWYKVAVFVPAEKRDDVARAMWEAGAGIPGGYDLASLSQPSEGTFRAKGGTGMLPRLQTVAGTRLEVVTRGRQVEDVVSAMRRVHPYETVSYDVFKLENSGEPWGMGLYGKLAEPQTIGEIAQRVRHALSPRSLRLVGDLSRKVSTVGICSGSGGDLAHRAADCGVELYITGEIRYHTALEVRDRGLAVLEIGHQASEEPVVDFLVGHLARQLPSTVPVEAFHELEPFEVLLP